MFWSRICQSRNNKQCFGQEYVNLATISNALVNEYVNLATITNVPKTKYMTLGPKFFCCSKMTITRRRMHLNSGANQKKYDIPHHLTVSNQDLKHFSKSDILGFAGAVFHGFLPPEGN